MLSAIHAVVCTGTGTACSSFVAINKLWANQIILIWIMVWTITNSPESIQQLRNSDRNPPRRQLQLELIIVIVTSPFVSVTPLTSQPAPPLSTGPGYLHRYYYYYHITIDFCGYHCRVQRIAIDNDSQWMAFQFQSPPWSIATTCHHIDCLPASQRSDVVCNLWAYPH